MDLQAKIFLKICLSRPSVGTFVGMLLHNRGQSWSVLPEAEPLRAIGNEFGK